MKFKNIKEKEVLSETQFYIVDSIKGDTLTLKNDEDKLITVSKEYAEKCLHSASQYDIVTKVSRTELVEVFMRATNKAITVNFNTQAKVDDAKKNLYELYSNKGGKLVSEDEFKTKVDDVVKTILVGKERTMVGMHYAVLTDFGRVTFIDMELEKDPAKPYENRTRQVDPRGLNWLIVNNNKYEIK